jgi:ketosteroid isomerase-like protein
MKTRETDIRIEGETQVGREGLFARLDDAFMRRNFVAFDEAVREDVVLELPGSSWLAGTFQGREAFCRHIAALRQVLRSADTPSLFLHEGDQMIVKHEMVVMGPRHVVEMALRIRVRFDADGEVASFVVVPEDLGLFDHVANSSRRSLQAV